MRKCEFCNKEFTKKQNYNKKQRFCSSRCRYNALPMPPRPDRTGFKPPNYKGRIMRNGYWVLHKPHHANSNKQGHIYEHRFNMSVKLGRNLKPTEIVHHMNHDKTDNRPENLMLLKSNKEHRKLHRRGLSSK